MTSEDVLVIILSCTLVLLLVLLIVVVIKGIQILNAIKRIIDKAEKIADNAGTISNIFAKTSRPAAIGTLITYIADSVFRGKDRKSRHKK